MIIRPETPPLLDIYSSSDDSVINRQANATPSHSDADPFSAAPDPSPPRSPAPLSDHFLRDFRDFDDYAENDSDRSSEDMELYADDRSYPSWFENGASNTCTDSHSVTGDDLLTDDDEDALPIFRADHGELGRNNAVGSAEELARRVRNQVSLMDTAAPSNGSPEGPLHPNDASDSE